MLRRPLSPYLVRLRLYGLVLLSMLLSGIQKGHAQLSFGQKASTCTFPNGSITVTANFGMGPYWFYIDEGSGFSTYIVSPTNTLTYNGLIGGKTYYFRVIDLDGAGTLVPGDQPLADLAAPGISVVPQAATCLNNDGSLQINAIGGNGPFQYQLNGGTFTTGNTFINLPSGAATARIMDNNGCYTPITPVTIPLNDDLTVSVAAIPPICEGAGIQLPAVSNGDNFRWAGTDGLSDPTILNPVASPPVTTTYTLSAFLGICPAKTVPVTVVVNPAPIANAGADLQTCYGKTVVLQGSGGKFYHWTPSTGLTNPNVPFPIVVKPDTTITYVLSVTDANGCTSLKSDSATVFVTPPLKVFAGPDTIVSIGQPVQLYAIGPADASGLTYQWTPTTGLSDPLSQTPIAILNAPAEIDYIVKLTTGVGCTGADTVVVKALAVSDILVPNAFSPNNDGHNDVLRPIIPGIKTLKYFTIFDRWGRQVFTTSNAGIGWDGRLKGQVMETGVYVWMAMGEDMSGKVVQRKGTVILVH